MTAPRESPTPRATDAGDALWRAVRALRTLVLWAAPLVAILAIVGFVGERISVGRARQTGTVLRVATHVQHLAWNAESGARAYLLARDSSAIARTGAAQDSLALSIPLLRELVSDDPSQGARLDSLEAALARWDTLFAQPTFAGDALTRALALSGTQAFDDAAHHLDEFIAIQSALRVSRFGQQALAASGALFGLLIALGIAATIAWRLTRGLEHEASLALERQRRIEEQAAELEQQASTLEAQASQLEDQANELRARILERDETNRLLTQTATFLDSALESAPFGIAFYDRALRFIRINDTLARINGAPAAAHLGRRLEEVIPALAPSIRPTMERVLASGTAEPNVVLEGETPARPGDRRRWLVTYYPILRPGEPPLGVGTMVVDVTEQHHLEQKLRQAQKLEAVGRLAGGIAHDFNNVLTVIQSYAEVLAFELEEKQIGREEVNAIRAAADRAAALARQLLAFSRRDVIILRDLDVNEVVRGLDLILRRLLKQGVELVAELSPEPLIVRLDAGQLEQVVMNLMINAVDAMPTGGVLRLRTARAAPADGAGTPRALITVEDSGTGMQPEVLERLFEPFFTTKPAGQGTGLGLATAYAIVHEAGGTIGVDSVLGRGTRFDVALPLSSATEADAARRATPAHGTVAAKPGEVVLLVEDEPAIRTALARVLRASGYRVLEAAHGGEALRLAEAESGHIDLLLTDVMMPGIGGKELVQRLLQTRPTTRVILMSGFTDDLDLRESLGAAKFLFLQKPFAARRVLSAVREVLEGA